MTQIAEQKKSLSTKEFFSQQNVRAKFEEMLGKRAPQFITSVLQIVSQNDMLMKADTMSIYNAAAVAATLDLPLNSNLGFAYIVPYNNRQKDGSYKQVAQFQMGYKGFIQLAQRSGQFRTINSTDVRDGEIKRRDRLTGEIEFQWNEADRHKKPIIGFVAYFKLNNGFEKSLYMEVDEIKAHGAKYSKTFKLAHGLWTTDFEGMAHKTVVKLLLARFAPLSIEMQKAVITDQGLINDDQGTDVTYMDNDAVVIDKEEERVTLMLQDAKTPEELEALRRNIKTDGHAELFAQRMEELKPATAK